jgi:tRNA(Ile)-lysidine synthase
MVPELQLVERLRDDLDALIAPEARLGIAVSGGPDSAALLLLAAAARPGRIEAATVDHGLREGSRGEADIVAQLCRSIGVPHETLVAGWKDKPATAIQERARRERYRLLGFWAAERRLAALVTAHHADDQAETLLMRLVRGAGVRGLAGMRRRSVAPGSDLPLLRPLLGWRRSELAPICAQAAFSPVADPSNDDERFERVRIRHALADSEWLDAAALARSATHLSDAQAALEWAAREEWKRGVKPRGQTILYRPDGAPAEILRRIAARAVGMLATEGEPELRGREIDQLLASLDRGADTTIRGVRCEGGAEWRFSEAPPRRG